MVDRLWIVKREFKESGNCFACGTYKHTTYFYDWYKHPAIRLLFDKKDRYNGKICLKCAKRETGTKPRSDLNI